MPLTTAQDVTLYYEEAGSGPPLLILNGLGGNTLAVAWLVEKLTDRFRVVSFDARGAGQSAAPPGPYTMLQLADDAAAVLDDLGIARAHVFGLSFGGFVAQELALAHPGRVDRLVLYGTQARPHPVFFEAWSTFLLQTKERELDPAGSALWLMSWMFTPAFMANHDQVEEAMAGWLDDPYPAPVHGLAGQIAAIRGHDTRDRLGQVTAPTLVVVGSEDILTPVADARELAEGIPEGRLQVLEGGGHLALAECNDAFMDALQAFLLG